jgi:hypothetical protein
VSDQSEAAGKKLSGLAEDAATQVKDQAEAVIASIASSEQVTKAKKRARKVQKQAAKKGLELGEEAKKRGQAAIASAPAVAAAARKSAAKKGEHAFEVARERGGELLLSALESDPGKRLANTPAGGALKTKLTRKRRRRKLALLLALNGAGAVAFKQLRARKSESVSASSYDVGVGVPAATPPTETVAPVSTGTEVGDPLTGITAGETVSESPVVAEETRRPPLPSPKTAS